MRKYTAEFIGTFALIFCGTVAVIINQETNGIITHVGVAITWGLIVMSMIYARGWTQCLRSFYEPGTVAGAGCAVASRLVFMDLSDCAGGGDSVCGAGGEVLVRGCETTTIASPGELKPLYFGRYIVKGYSLFVLL